jgi:hypothetical protein
MAVTERSRFAYHVIVRNCPNKRDNAPAAKTNGTITALPVAEGNNPFMSSLICFPD